MDEQVKNSILIVDDESANIMMLTDILGSEYTIYAAKSGKNALSATEKFKPDLILLDVIMPEMDGYAVIAELKKSERARNIPVIFITGLNDAISEEKGLSLGAADYITKPFNKAVVKLRVQNQIKMLNQMRLIERISMIDQLTSIPNRRGFDNRIEMEWRRAIRDKTMLGILLLDVDQFKKYNDTYGHGQGDAALREVAKILKHAINRPADFAARWGGEEFVVLLPGNDIDGAANLAETIRAQVSESIVYCVDGTETKITVSIGANARSPRQDGSVESFISDADKALYNAKESGRNRVCRAET